MLTAGILHNDIKPENILLVSSHPDFAVKVADFGFARTHEHCSSGQVTQGYGTKGYMAPEVEQLACRSHYSDMYSIGAVFHFMLFGEDHFLVKDGKTASATGLAAIFMTAVSLVYIWHALPGCGPCCQCSSGSNPLQRTSATHVTSS